MNVTRSEARDSERKLRVSYAVTNLLVIDDRPQRVGAITSFNLWVAAVGSE